MEERILQKKHKIGSVLYITLCFLFLYLPILVTMIFSFNSSKSLTRFQGFSLTWYERLFTDSEIMGAVYVSISIALLATVISTILGTITAIGLSKSRKIIKEIIINVNNIPIMNPDIVTAIGLMILFSSLKIEKGYLTMLLAHVCFCTPYVITSVYPKVRSLDPALANAAMDLGATPFQALTKVILPMIKEGIFAGVLLAFTMSFDDFVVSYFITGNGVKNISIVVYNMTRRTNPTINALSTIVILVIMITLVVVNIVPVITKKRSRKNLELEKEGIFISKNNRLKKYTGIVSAVVLIVIIVLTSYAGNRETLKIFNAGEYIDPDLITEFEKDYNCRIIYETFDSNESMYTKIMSGETYDIIVPSDYMIERLIKENRLAEIDWDRLSNRDNLNKNIMGMEFDSENKYSVPYFYGTVGILYDKTVVKEEDLKDGWNLLKNTRYKNNIYMYDSERDAFMIALKALGYSMNTDKKEEIDAAYNWLIEQRVTMNPVDVGDDVIDNMIAGNKALAVVYSGDAAYIMAENPNLEFFNPDEGTNEWFDCMVIMNSSEKTALAHKFIDFMLDVEHATANSSFVGYTSPVEGAYQNMMEMDYKGISSYTPVMGHEKNEIFRYQSAETKGYFADLWTKVKAH